MVEGNKQARPPTSGMVTPEQQTNHGQESEDKQKQSTWQRLERKGLNPLKNWDTIIILLYSAGLFAAVNAYHLEYYKIAAITAFAAAILVPALLVTDKGDIATIVTIVYNAWKKRRLDKKEAQIKVEKRKLNKKEEDMVELSIWDRTDYKK